MILVTGASGFIGQHLVRALVADGNDVRALVRSEEAAAKAKAAGAQELARGDLADAEALKAAAAGCELVYHLAGSYRGSPSELQSSHVAGTARLLRSIERDARFVYVSSTSVYGWYQDWPADETAPLRPESAYGSAKLAAERLVLARTAGESVVVRPTITYGVGDEHGMLARAYHLLKRGIRWFPGTGHNRIHLTHVDDLVAGLVAAGQKGKGVYLMAGPSATAVRELFGLLAEGAGLAGPAFGLPAGAARAAAQAFQMAWSVLGRQGEAPLSRHSIDVLTRDRAYVPRRAERELGWSPRVTAQEGLPPVGAWLAARDRGRPAEPAKRSRRSDTEPSAAAIASGNATSGREDELGFDWRGYVTDPDEGLGTVYERFALRDVLQAAVDRSGSRSVLHAPLFGMMGFPGLDAVFLARAGVRVGLLDFLPERLDAVVAEWRELGLEPEAHLVDGADPTTWPHRLSADYDLVFSFAALWWFDDPWAVIEAQARWADKAVLTCVPNKNVFIRIREHGWHKGLFDRLNLEALDRDALVGAAQRLGLEPVDTGLFDIPPFPDTSVPLAKVVRALLGKQRDPAVTTAAAPPAAATTTAAAAATAEGAWAWSILPYLRGERPDLEERIATLAAWERYLPAAIAPGLAHHRYTLFLPASA